MKTVSGRALAGCGQQTDGQADGWVRAFVCMCV